VKPLGVIWGKFEQYNAKNTIMFDDIRRNFIMNPKNGLRIRPFRQAHLNRDKDNELLKLSKYLKAWPSTARLLVGEPPALGEVQTEEDGPEAIITCRCFLNKTCITSVCFPLTSPHPEIPRVRLE
jgi:hypothetical protein